MHVKDLQELQVFNMGRSRVAWLLLLMQPKCLVQIKREVRD